MPHMDILQNDILALGQSFRKELKPLLRELTYSLNEEQHAALGQQDDPLHPMRSVFPLLSNDTQYLLHMPAAHTGRGRFTDRLCERTASLRVVHGCKLDMIEVRARLEALAHTPLFSNDHHALLALTRLDHAIGGFIERIADFESDHPLPSLGGMRI